MRVKPVSPAIVHRLVDGLAITVCGLSIVGYPKLHPLVVASSILWCCASDWIWRRWHSVDELQRENARLKAECVAAEHRIESLCVAHEEAFLRADAADARLREYGQHKEDCEWTLSDPSPVLGLREVCTCGFDASKSCVIYSRK